MSAVPKNSHYEELIEELRLEVGRLRDFAELSSDWFWEQDEEFRFVGFSGTSIERINRSQSDFIGRRRWDMPICHDYHQAMLEHKAVCERHEPFQDFQYDLYDSSGRRQRFTVSGTPIFDRSGEFCGYRGIGSNITELYQARKAVKEAQQQLAQIVVGSPIASFVIDINHKVTHWNKACEALTGLSAEKAIGSIDAWRGFYTHPRPVMANLVLSGAIDVEIKKHYGNKYRHSELVPGAYEATDFFPGMHGGRWLYFTAIPLFDENGLKIGAVETLQDITEQKKQEERILHQAHFDSLTNLPNRFLSLDRLNLLIEEAKRTGNKVAVLFIDLDDFKKVNDTLGHAIGDELLIHSAKRLRSAIRTSDTIGRLGGDEFIVLINNLTDVKDVQPIAENLLERFRDVFRVDNRDLLLTASVGISVYPNDGNTPEKLLRNADSAMYFSKNQGRNIYHFFSDEMNKGVSRRLQIEEQMHGALGRSEFELHYQPVVNVETGRVEGAEALLRWNNPELGSVSPVEFIPIAEQTGLIIPIGKFVLNEALRTLKNWNDKFKQTFGMAINLSPVQFRDPKLLQRIRDGLDKNQLQGSCLNLEITEGVLLGNHQHVKQSFDALIEMGIKISMDDFGTGYSSLNYLREYQFDTLKIDRGFLQDFEQDDTAAALIDATIAMAHALNVEVIAEGVETKEQHDYLILRQCNYAQGYLFSRPVPAEEFVALLEQTQSNQDDSENYCI